MPESAEQMVDVVSQAVVGLGVGAYLLSLAALAFVVFGWGVAVAIRRGNPDGALWMLALAGAVLYAAHILGWVSVLRQGFFLAVSDAAAATAVDTMMRGPFDKILWSPDWMFPGILLIGATGLASRTGAGLPRALGRVSVVFAAALVAVAAVGDATLSPLSSIGFPLFLLVWIPWTSIVLLRQR